jgi:hypothetical protein
MWLFGCDVSKKTSSRELPEENKTLTPATPRFSIAGILCPVVQTKHSHQLALQDQDLLFGIKKKIGSICSFHKRTSEIQLALLERVEIG